MKDNGLLNNADYDCSVKETSEEKNINQWPRDPHFDILVKKLAAFCSCPKYLLEAKSKGF